MVFSMSTPHHTPDPDATESPVPGSAPKPDPRERKLAEALRRNLARRKQAARTTDAG
jgi:hypothetical protein